MIAAIAAMASGYKEVTSSTDPEVKQARERFAAILKQMPEPKPKKNGATKIFVTPSFCQNLLCRS